MISRKTSSLLWRKQPTFIGLVFLLILQSSILLVNINPPAHAPQSLSRIDQKAQSHHVIFKQDIAQSFSVHPVSPVNKMSTGFDTWELLSPLSGGVGNFVKTGQRVGVGAWSVGVGDLNNDGHLDLFIAKKYNLPNEVWLNNGSGYFIDSGQRFGNSDSEGLALGDLDNDGDLDAFIANTGTQANEVWLNIGNGIFLDSGQRLGNSYSTAVALGDLDGDGDLDAFVSNWNNEPDQVWFNNGDGTFTSSQQTFIAANGRAVKLGDLDGDGDLDVFVGNWGGNHVWLNNGNGFFIMTSAPLGDEYTVGVALGDLNGDSTLDAFTVNRDGQPNRVWLNDGDGVFYSNNQALGFGHSEAVALGDIDQDGDLDAIVANGIKNDLWPGDEVWLNNGSGSFANAFLPLGNANSEAVALADFNNDGALDLFIGNGYIEEPGNQIYLNQAGCTPGQLCNGNFEQDIQYWQLDDFHELTLSGHNGLFGLRSQQTSLVTEPAAWAGLRQRIQVIPGQSYSYSFWLRSENAVNPHVKLDWFNASGEMIGSTQLPLGIPANTGAWLHFIGQVNARPGATTTEIAFWHGVSNETNAPGSTLYLDDLAISPAPCAGPELCNPGFETGSAGWESDETVTLVPDAYSGNWALQSTQQRPPTASPAWAGIRQYIPVISERSYSLAVRARWETVTNLHIKLIWFDTAGTEVGSDIIYDRPGTISGNGEWLLIERTTFVPANITMAEIVIWHGVNQDDENAPGSQVTLDDFSFNIAGNGGEKPWTVMVYLNGDNNLDLLTAAAFNRLEAAANNPNVNIVVLWDRSVNTGGAWDSGTRLYHVQYDANPYELANYSENVNVWDKEEQNLGDDFFLYSFVTWARSSFPAEHYLLIISDHGGGWSPELPDGLPRRGGWALGGTGLSWDDTGLDGEPDFLSTHETGKALRVLSNDGQNPLDIVFYDACLMGMLEEVYEIRDYAKYLIASENIAWATFPYNYYIDAITHDTEPAALANAIANTYIQSLPPSYAGTIAVYNLSRTDDIAAKTNALATSLLIGQQNAAVREQIRTAYLLSQKVDYDSDGEIIPNREGYVDLHDFAWQIDNLVSSPDIVLAAQSLMTALNSDEFIVFEAHRSGQWNLENVRGLSIYLPFGEELYIGSGCTESTTNPCESNNDANCLKLRDFYTTATPPQTIQLAFTQNTNWDEFINGFIEAQYCEDDTLSNNSPQETRGINILDSPRQGNLPAYHKIHLPLVLFGN